MSELAVCLSMLGPSCFPADCILLQSVLQCSLISVVPFLLSPFPGWQMSYSLFHFFCFSTEAVCALAFVSKFKLHTQVRVETDLITQPDVPTIGSAAIPHSVHPGRETKGPYKHLTTGNEKGGVAMLSSYCSFNSSVVKSQKSSTHRSKFARSFSRTIGHLTGRRLCAPQMQRHVGILNFWGFSAANKWFISTHKSWKNMTLK